MPALDYLEDINDGHIVQLSVTSELNTRSNSVEFLVYDVLAMVVTEFVPSEGLHYVFNTITIYGEGFIDTTEQACHISLDNANYISPATFIGEMELVCTLPALPYSTIQTISVSLNQQEATYIPTQNNATSFIFTVDPPMVISAKFNSPYTGLYVLFDREIEVGSVAIPKSPNILTCSVLFSLETINMLGVGAKCEWRNTQQREICVHLSKSSSVELATVLTLLGGTLRTRYENYSRLANGSINITMNSTPLIPLSVIEAPKIAPLCGCLLIDRKYSQGGGYAPLLYNWDIHANQDIELTSIKELFFPTGFSVQDHVCIESQVLLPDTEYYIELTVRNIFGRESSTSHSFTTSTSHFSSLFVKGGSTQKVCVHKSIELETTLINNNCLNNTIPAQYQWRIINTTDNNIVLLNTSVLTLPPYTLQHNQVYLIEVSTEHQNVNASVLLTTLEPCLVSSIFGGYYQEFDRSVAIFLDGSHSERLSTAVIQDPLFFAEWLCFTSGLPCFSQQGLQIFPITNVTTLIPPQTLPIGNYTFTLTLRYNNTVSIAETIVHVFGDSIPLLNIAVPCCSSLHPVHTNLSLSATVYSESSGFIQWAVETVPGK